MCLTHKTKSKSNDDTTTGFLLVVLCAVLGFYSLDYVVENFTAMAVVFVVYCIAIMGIGIFCLWGIVHRIVLK